MTSASGFVLMNVSGRLITSCTWDLKPPNLFYWPDALFIVSPHTCACPNSLIQRKRLQTFFKFSWLPSSTVLRQSKVNTGI